MSVDDMLARHQAVREFVEKRHPGCHVTEIIERAKTTYAWRIVTPLEMVLSSAEIVYDVEARGDTLERPSVRCKISMLGDGVLRMVDETLYFR
jgi:hypothetical protein